MAFKNKEIDNPRTGQTIRFVETSKDTNGAWLEMESIYKTDSVRPAAHYHPWQDEDFLVLEGELRVCVDGEERVLKRGDHLHITRGVVHSMWNQSGRRTVVSWRVTPALDTEYLLETTSGLARDGKTNETGQPAFLQSILLLGRFSGVFRISLLPFAVQKILFVILAPLARLMGYRSVYSSYLD